MRGFVSEKKLVTQRMTTPTSAVSSKSKETPEALKFSFGNVVKGKLTGDIDGEMNELARSAMQF